MMTRSDWNNIQACAIKRSNRHHEAGDTARADREFATAVMCAWMFTKEVK
jgi:hypothetical protein